MPKSIKVFKSPQSQAAYERAHREALSMWPVPYDETDVPTSYGSTHVIVSGARGSPPIVLFHPAGCGSAIWYRNVGVLSKHFRTYAVDTIGEVNMSIPVRRVGSREEFADWAKQLFSALGIGKADLIGNSFGGFLSLSIALLLPDQVKRVILISPAATFVQMWPWILHFFPAYMTGSKRLLRRAYSWIWQQFPVDSCIEEMRQITSRSGIPHHVGPSVFTDDELKGISCPTLLLVGDREVIYDGRKVIRRATKTMSNLSSEVVPNANHNAMYTAPEETNKKMLSFLVT